ncbi:MAG TPA: glycosyltransferase family 4 protein [Blastocatellia bacterium]|nr:glycosyltransferase family 4 protein [Blastocatellia bacterium]
MLAILTTHPIQYQVPLWQALARDGRVPFEVWYLTDHALHVSHDREFGKAFAWDINMLEGYPHRFLKTASEATPGSFWKCRLRESLAERIQASGVTALWVQGWQVAAYWQAVWGAKQAGIEVWLRAESNALAPAPFWKRRIKQLLLGQFFRRVDHFLYIGRANRRLYENYGVPADRLHPAPYAVDNDRFAQHAARLRPQRAALRKQWGVAEDAFCVLFCGKFIPKKRPLDIVAAARQLRESGQLSNIHLLFVGSGELGDALRRELQVVFDAENDSDQPSVKALDGKCPPASFAGFLNQTEIPKAYVVADCLVLPSDHGETWGLVVNEALASGLPCIVSDACGCAEDMGRLVGAEIFKLGRCAELAEGVHRFAKRAAQNPPLCNLHQDFSIQRTLSTVVGLRLRSM